jgi:hypothetical protein
MWRCALTFKMAEVSLEQLIKLSSGSDVERGEELPEFPNAGTCIICPTKENASHYGRWSPWQMLLARELKIIIIWLCVCIS